MLDAGEAAVRAFMADPERLGRSEWKRGLAAAVFVAIRDAQ